MQKDNRDRLIETLTGVASVATFLTVLIALIAFLQDLRQSEAQRLHDQRLERREASLEVVNRFSSGEVLAARLLILRGLMMVGPDQLQSVSTDSDSMADLARVMATATGDPIAYDQSLFVIADFYDSAYSCVEAGICDEATLNAQIGSYGARFHCFFRPVIGRLQADYRIDGLGKGVEIWSQEYDVC
ncbi:hypothetical protein [Notoacmeibacter ruber]|uniref:hypothetical protein n=1 Tax=Notoacmeibacter ruber TaxID=2670375 RepID=UPI0011C410FE|nr:hypothetical protein [Notoacmeibacter ruber]